MAYEQRECDDRSDSRDRGRQWSRRRRVSGDRSGLNSKRFPSVSKAGVRARAGCRCEGSWDELSQNPLAFAARSAELHLEVPDADVAAFARFLPPYLAPKAGCSSICITGRRHGGFSICATRPRVRWVARVLQEIDADLADGGRSSSCAASPRRQAPAVTLSGTIQFPTGARRVMTWRCAGKPAIHPPNRTARARRLDLKLHTPDAGPTAVSGTVRLRDSLFLSDVRAFYRAARRRRAPARLFRG